MAGSPAGDLARVQPLGIAVAPRGIDIPDPEIELKILSGRDRAVDFRQLQPRAVAELNDGESVTPRIGRRADRLKERDGLFKIGNGKTQMTQRRFHAG